jgi:aminoglycoside phosphotransferase (APT) family kinase protein
MESEEILAGGNMSTVARAGDTVRRSAGPWTEQVHRLLAHLRSKGIVEAPAPLGYDERGRAVLTYLPGVVGHEPLPELRTDAVLVDAAQLLRRIHDATTDVAQSWPAGWQAPTRQPVEVICHGDFAPYNCVFDGGRLVGVIDFDHAHPGSRAWDIAYALYRFAPLMHPSNPDSYGTVAEQGRRARLFCDAYGVPDRAALVPVILARVAYMAEYLLEGAARQDGRIQANIDAGHLRIYQTDSAYLMEQQAQLTAALTNPSQDESVHTY